MMIESFVTSGFHLCIFLRFQSIVYFEFSMALLHLLCYNSCLGKERKRKREEERNREKEEKEKKIFFIFKRFSSGAEFALPVFLSRSHLVPLVNPLRGTA